MDKNISPLIFRTHLDYFQYNNNKTQCLEDHIKRISSTMHCEIKRTKIEVFKLTQTLMGVTQNQRKMQVIQLQMQRLVHL